MPKPERTFRIISLGGSTTYGQPYINNTSFPKWTEVLLDKFDLDYKYESINGGAISYASYRVRRLMEELVQFSPDLYVVFSGHNEFLEHRTFQDLMAEKPLIRSLRGMLHRSRLYSSVYRVLRKIVPRNRSADTTVLRDGVSARLEEVGGPDLYHRDDAFRAGVIRQYRHNVESMVRFAREHGIPLVLCTAPSNLSAFPPFKSEHQAGLSEGDLSSWEGAYSRGLELLDQGKYEQALTFFRQAERIDDRHAALFYAKGRAYASLSRHRKAYKAYERAKEEDVIPLRALRAFNATLREIASREGVALADVDRAFRQLSPGRGPGENLFADHVHPTLEGQQLVALLIVDAATEAGLVPLRSRVWQDRRGNAVDFLRAEIQKVSLRYRAMGKWVVGRTLYWGGKYEEARKALAEAWEVVRDVPEIPRLMGKLELFRGNADKALLFLKEAERILPGHPETLLSAAAAYVEQGHGERALGVLDLLAGSSWEENPYYHSKRAVALHLAGRIEEAQRELEMSVRMGQRHAGFGQEIAYVYGVFGDQDKAKDHYREYLRVTKVAYPQQVLAEWMKALSPPPLR